MTRNREATRLMGTHNVPGETGPDERHTADLERLQKDNQRLREKLDKLLLKKPTGPRGQTVTLADCVETNEGYFYGLRAQEAELRELDVLAYAERLAKAIRNHGPWMDDECRAVLDAYDAFRSRSRGEHSDGSECGR